LPLMPATSPKIRPVQVLLQVPFLVAETTD
jgi:hypothetical protein